MSKSKLFSIIMAVFFLTVTVGVGAADAQKKFNLKLGHVMSSAHPYQVGGLKFAELVKERTGGNVIIEVYPASQLGGEREGCEALQLGTLDFQITSTAPLANFNKSTVVFDLPFLFEDKAHARKTLDSEYGVGKLAALESVGMVGLSYLENSYFDIIAAKPVIEPGDMAGLTIRVLENNILMSFMKVLGANPVPMAWSEVSTAIQNGTIDAIHTSFVAICDLGLYKNMHYTYLDCLYTPVPLIASKITWDSLPKEYQDIIRQAAKEASVHERQWIDDHYAEMEETAKKGGLTIHQGNSQAWIAKTVKPVYDEYVGKLIPKSDVEAVNSYRQTPPVYVP